MSDEKTMSEEQDAEREESVDNDEQSDVEAHGAHVPTPGTTTPVVPPS
jgi:hypothetical protein